MWRRARSSSPRRQPFRSSQLGRPEGRVPPGSPSWPRPLMARASRFASLMALAISTPDTSLEPRRLAWTSSHVAAMSAATTMKPTTTRKPVASLTRRAWHALEEAGPRHSRLGAISSGRAGQLQVPRTLRRCPASVDVVVGARINIQRPPAVQRVRLSLPGLADPPRSGSWARANHPGCSRPHRWQPVTRAGLDRHAVRRLRSRLDVAGVGVVATARRRGCR